MNDEKEIRNEDEMKFELYENWLKNIPIYKAQAQGLEDSISYITLCREFILAADVNNENKAAWSAAVGFIEGMLENTKREASWNMEQVIVTSQALQQAISEIKDEKTRKEWEAKAEPVLTGQKPHPKASEVEQGSNPKQVNQKMKLIKTQKQQKTKTPQPILRVTNTQKTKKKGKRTRQKR